MESLIQKKGDATERRVSIVKSRKIYIYFFWGGEGGAGRGRGVEWLLKILWDAPFMRVVWKLLNTFHGEY